MSQDYASIIVDFPLFKGYTTDGAQALLACGEVKELEPGEILFKEGDPPLFVLLVLKGSLQVYVERSGRDLVLTDSGPGTIIGELAVLCGIARSASVRSVEPAAVLQLSATSFRSLLLRNTFLSERVFGQALRTLIEKEQALIAELTRS
ncbi:MAG: cyclic nucleotide-binding domain-containing protein [Acidobacteriota bacterium]|nr:MAG: cyclic nucleotide-binding domain-containing protein [Acidobacteriota bacterium]